MIAVAPVIPVSPVIDVERVRGHFLFPETGRVVTNNAASTQPPRELVDLFRTLAPDYENVHRGQSAASQLTTALFEDAYDTIADSSTLRRVRISSSRGTRPKRTTSSCIRC